jgi:hypothetical protein
VLTSILKPVDDTRMFEKFGVSLGQTNKYDVNIIGFAIIDAVACSLETLPAII